MSNDHLLKRQRNNQGTYCPSSRQVALIAALWTRMSQLYRHRWDKSEGPQLNEKKKFSSNFLLWCRKTEHLSDDDWARGFDKLEAACEKAGETGETAWPPTYAEFVGLCQEPVSNGMYKLSYTHQLLPEPEDVKEERKKKGLKGLEGVRSIVFDD